MAHAPKQNGRTHVWRFVRREGSKGEFVHWKSLSGTLPSCRVQQRSPLRLSSHPSFLSPSYLW